MNTFYVEQIDPYFAQTSRILSGDPIFIGSVFDRSDSYCFPNPNKAIVTLHYKEDSIIVEEDHLDDEEAEVDIEKKRQSNPKPTSMISVKRREILEGEIYLLGRSKIYIEDKGELLVITVRKRKDMKIYRLPHDDYFIGTTDQCSIRVDEKVLMQIRLYYQDNKWEIDSMTSALWMFIRNIRAPTSAMKIELKLRENNPLIIQTGGLQCLITKLD